MTKERATAVFDDGKQKVIITAYYDFETSKISLDVEFTPAIKNDKNREPSLAEVLAGGLVSFLTN